MLGFDISCFNFQCHTPTSATQDTSKMIGLSDCSTDRSRLVNCKRPESILSDGCACSCTFVQLFAGMTVVMLKAKVLRVGLIFCNYGFDGLF